MRIPYSQEVLACRAGNFGQRISRKGYAVSTIARLIEKDQLASEEDADHKPLDANTMGGLVAALLDLGDSLIEEAESLREVDYETTD